MAGETILVIEDNEKNRKLIKVVLKAKGYKIIEAEDAETAMDQLKKDIPDLILMDIGLPGMDGFELTRLIKRDKTTKDVPIIAVTAHAMKGEKEKTLEAGCDDYVSKPIDINEFQKTVARVLNDKKQFRD
ncbi:MAG: response regulator [Candidatus Anammoxibacter sp.]